MVTITDSTVRQNVYETVYDVISSTMTSYNAETSTVRLFGGYPDEKDVTFPCIILNPISVVNDNYTIDTVRSSSDKNIFVVIDIFATKNKHLDYLADGIINALQSPINGMTLTNADDTYGLALSNDNKIKQKTLSLTFLRR